MEAALLANLLEDIEEGVAHVSTDGLILYANPRFAQLIGGELLRIEANKTHLKNLMSAACWTDLNNALKLAAREPVSGQLRVEDAARTVARTIRLALFPIFWKSKVTIKLTATEMTELLEKNTELQRKEDELHAISARIMQLQDEERRRIARDLHDITGQELAVVIMLLMQAAREQRADTDSLKTITDAASMIRKIEDEIRTLSYVLHPPLLDELGLGAALNWYIEGFAKRSGIDVKIEVQQGLPRLPKEKELTLFRVVQEGLTNVMRHSGSRTAQLHVFYNAESVTLSIQDEGKGIKSKRFAQSTPGGQGVGIPGMRERIQQFGGTIEVRPLEKGTKGTEVIAVMPIGYEAPIEMPFSENDILDMARALGYKGYASEPRGTTTAPPEASAATAAPPIASGAAIPPPEAAQVTAGQAPPVQPSANSAVSFTKKRILIADDHEVTRQGIRGLLQQETDLEVCGEAQDAVDAVTKARALNPDLIVMDLSMPGGGFSAANRVRQLGLSTRVLFFTTHRAEEIERMARLAGYEGFVQKTEAARDLTRGIRAVLGGQRFYGGQVIPAEDESSKRRRAQMSSATPPGRAQTPRHR